MKRTKLDLIILDDSSLVMNPLKTYLQQRFGERINLSTYVDKNECIQNIGNNSHVLILNYAMKGEELGAHNRDDIFKDIKQNSPTTPVTIVTPKKNVFDAKEEIKKRVSTYINNIEWRFSDIFLYQYRAFFPRVKKSILEPASKLTLDYSIAGYILMIIAACTTVIILVVTAKLLIG